MKSCGRVWGCDRSNKVTKGKGCISQVVDIQVWAPGTVLVTWAQVCHGGLGSVTDKTGSAYENSTASPSFSQHVGRVWPTVGEGHPLTWHMRSHGDMWKARQTWVKDWYESNQQIREAPDVWAGEHVGTRAQGQGKPCSSQIWNTGPPSFYSKFGTTKKEKGRLWRVSRILQEPTCSHILYIWSLRSLFQKNRVESSAALDTRGYVPRWHLQIWLYFIPYHVTENNNDSGQTITSFIVQTNYNWQHICNMYVPFSLLCAMLKHDDYLRY